MNKKPTLSVFSIMYNEEELCERALKSVSLADELVVLIDDRTNDKTEEIARRYTDKIHKFTWQDSFSEAKNLATSYCTGDWVMGIDADCFLEEGGMEKIRDIISRTKFDVINMLLVPESDKKRSHERAKIYKNNGNIVYKGRAHEDLTTLGKNDEGGVVVKMYWGYSNNHFKDPDRYIRILTKACEEEPHNTRWKFYLAREYYYKKDWESAIEMFKDYLKRSKYAAEKTEAYVLISQCYWFSQQGNKAREACLRAIQFNPDHKEALKWMALYHNEPWKSKWWKIAEQATNKDVIFKKD